MIRKTEQETLIASLAFSELPEGPVLHPLEPRDDISRRVFLGWETPLAPWGGFGLDPGMAVERQGDQAVLVFTGEKRDRALLYTAGNYRDGRLVAQVEPLDAEAGPHDDRNDCSEALVGLVFRVQTSRHYYFFGIEGRRRAVLYRRRDDEWFLLAAQEVSLPEGFVTLEVELDGDGIRCRCPELDVHFLCTDTTFQEGKVGIRSLGRSRVAGFRFSQTPSQMKRDSRRRQKRIAQERERGATIPDPVLVRVFDLSRLGGMPLFVDFAVPGRYDMLIPTPEGLRAMTVEGQMLWETNFSVRQIVFSKGHGPQGRRIYGLTGRRTVKKHRDLQGRVHDTVIADSMVVLEGQTGRELARRPLPEMHERIRMPDYAQTSANFTDTGGFDIVLREWREDLGGGGAKLWAYDANLNPLWEYELPGAWYGHHYAVQVCDVDGDGRDELLAGGTLLDAAGRVLWVHDRNEEMLRIRGAHHYDAVIIGPLAEDPAVDPVAFLLGGSAGVYVVDGLTGRTRAVHRIGHAQGRMVGKLRADLPGQQVLAVTRWGNMGILTLFSGHGERLWTIQPDFLGQGSQPVQWGQADVQYLWTNTTGPVQAFYDGHGRRVKVLHELRRLWGERMRTQVSAQAIRMGRETTDYLTLGLEGKLYVFGPAE